MGKMHYEAPIYQVAKKLNWAILINQQNPYFFEQFLDRWLKGFKFKRMFQQETLMKENVHYEAHIYQVGINPD